MKKKLVMMITALTMVAGAVTGCGSATETVETAIDAEEVAKTDGTDVVTEAASEVVGIANPWVEITEEEANANCARLFHVPEGATEQVWSMCEALGNPEEYLGSLVQLKFKLYDMEFTARAQQGAAEDADIAGIYTDWTVGPEDVQFANWAAGNMTGKTYRAVGESDYTDLVTWYDIEVGIAYSLSVTASDLEGFDIVAVADQMAPADEEYMYNMASDFLQEQSGKLKFDSYDDAIAALTSGQGYAYVKLQGSDEELLLVTDLVFEYDSSAYQASIYGKTDNGVTFLSLVTGNGSAYPLRYEDGIIYAGDNHEYSTYFLSKEYASVMMKDYITDGVNSGNNELTGFTRTSNSFDVEAENYTGTLEDFQKLIAERENKPVIKFTAIK